MSPQPIKNEPSDGERAFVQFLCSLMIAVGVILAADGFGWTTTEAVAVGLIALGSRSYV